MDEMETETLNKAFMKEHKVSDPSTLALMEQLKSMATGKDLTKDIAYYYCHHNLMNRLSITDMRALLKKRKLHKKFLRMH